MYKGVSVYSNSLLKSLKDYDNLFLPSLDNIVIKVKNGSFLDGEGIPEDELAIITIAVRIYRDIIKGDGRKISSNNGRNGIYINSQWLTSWIFETVNSNVHHLSKYNGNGFNYRILLVNGDIISWNTD